MRLLKMMQERERFSETEQGTLTYILAHASEMGELTIRELSTRACTSPAAVFRLCQKLGMKGYNDFKLKFISETSRTLREGHITHRPITRQDKPEDIVRKMAGLEIESIEETKNELDIAQLTRVADAVEAATCIDLYAYDQNHFLAQAAAYNFLQVGCPIVTVHPALNSQIASAMLADKTHLAMLLSRTGINRRILRVAEILKQRGTPMVLFSPVANSPLAHLADEYFYVANTVEYLDCGGAMYSVGVRYLFDVLFGILLARRSQNIEDFEKEFDEQMLDSNGNTFW